MSTDLRYEEFNNYGAVASAAPSERAIFVKRVYGHLAGAVLAFVAIEAAIFSSGMAEPLIKVMFGVPYSMLFLMLLFIGGGYAAQAMARSATSNVARYAGLGLYVLLEVVIFLPILYVAELRFPGQYLPLQAGVVTLAAFAGLTFFTVVSGKNFSFLGPILSVMSFVALGVVIVSLFTGQGPGFAGIFAAAMVILAAGYIVYDTSNIMYAYRSDQYVSASLELFASVALMFFYILRLFMAFGSNND